MIPKIALFWRFSFSLTVPEVVDDANAVSLLDETTSKETSEDSCTFPLQLQRQFEHSSFLIVVSSKRLLLLFSFSASTTSNCDEVVITSFDSVLLEEELELLDVIEFFGVSLVEEVDVEENSSGKKIVVCMMRFTFAQWALKMWKNKSICALFQPTFFFQSGGVFWKGRKRKKNSKNMIY